MRPTKAPPGYPPASGIQNPESRIGWGAILLWLFIGGCSDPHLPDTPTARAVAWLMKQEAGGLWKSETYALLKSGQVLTPFVLYAVSHAPEPERAPFRDRIDRALDRLPIEGAEYPSYSLALSILALKRLRPGADVGDLERSLKALQLTEANGWNPDDVEYGGWDHGVVPPKKPQCQNPDMSVTAMAAEALGGDVKAERFARTHRHKEGGYFFTLSRNWLHQNKAGPGTPYATPTYDALRILGDEAPERAWFDALPESAPRVFDLPEKWEDALFFYHAFARSKVRPSKELGRAVAARQRQDGSFASAHALMKEDDPLIATGLALIAMARCR